MSKELIDECPHKTEAQWEAEMWAELAKLERQTFWKLFSTLLWGMYDRGEGDADCVETLDPFWKYWIYRRLCGLAMLLGRSQSKKDKFYDYETLAWANLTGDGYNYSLDTIAYNPKSFRYSQDRDGDSTY